jgi:hypothetical protein
MPKQRNFHVSVCPETFSFLVTTPETMHDDSRAHFNLAVRDILSNTYHNRRMGRKGPIAWPARSPELNPLGFHVREHRKSLFVCSSYSQGRGNLYYEVMHPVQTASVV